MTAILKIIPYQYSLTCRISAKLSSLQKSLQKKFFI